MHKIEQEILEKTKAEPQRKGERRGAYLRRLIAGLRKLSDDDWDDLSEQTQDWQNNAIDAIDAGKEPADFDGGGSSEPEEAAAEPEATGADTDSNGDRGTDQENEVVKQKIKAKAKSAKKNTDETKATKKKTAAAPKAAKTKAKTAAPKAAETAKPKAAKKAATVAPKPPKKAAEDKAPKAAAKADKPKANGDDRSGKKRGYTDLEKATEIMIPMIAKDASLAQMRKELDKRRVEISTGSLRACSSWIKRVVRSLTKQGMLKGARA